MKEAGRYVVANEVHFEADQELMRRQTHSVSVPLHAPVAVPGLRKNLPSYSVAWNLQESMPEQERLDSLLALHARCDEDILMCMSRDEHVDIHLSCNRTERVQVARGDGLVSVYDTDLDWRVCYGYGHREGRVLQARVAGRLILTTKQREGNAPHRNPPSRHSRPVRRRANNPTSPCRIRCPCRGSAVSSLAQGAS